MKNHVLILCFGLMMSVANAQFKLDNISFSRNVVLDSVSGNYSIKNKVLQEQDEQNFTYGNLRLYMLKGNEKIRAASKDMGHYLSLQEAVKQGKIQIKEVEGGSVNTLVFRNISKDTVLILAGEIVTGGKQDRVVGNDILMVPNSGDVEVEVFCVEHGRWTPEENGNEFKGYFGVSSAAVRKQAVVDKDQSGVWSKVADLNIKNKTETSTGAYKAILNSDSLKTQLDQYLGFFSKKVMADSNYIGFVAVTGDTIIGCDLFANNQLFRNHAEPLLKAAAVEAATNGAPVKIAAAVVLAFLAEFLKDEVDQENKVNEKGTMLKYNEKKLHMNYYQMGKGAKSSPEIRYRY